MPFSDNFYKLKKIRGVSEEATQKQMFTIYQLKSCFEGGQVFRHFFHFMLVCSLRFLFTVFEY